MTATHAELLREARKLLTDSRYLGWNYHAMKCAERIDAALSAPTVEGWKWVPVDATQEMLDAGNAADYAATTHRPAALIWARMLSSAPQQASGKPEVCNTPEDYWAAMMKWMLSQPQAAPGVMMDEPSTAPANSSGKLREGE